MAWGGQSHGAPRPAACGPKYPLCHRPESITVPMLDGQAAYTIGGSMQLHFPESKCRAVLLPESFRGGCSFGVANAQALTISPAMTKVCALLVRVKPS